MGKSKKKSKSTLLPPSNAKISSPPPAPTSISAPTAEDTSASQPTEPETHPQDFPSFYLAAVTAAFADDLEKLRLASDFKDSSVPILIEALQQGAEMYGEGERKAWMGR